MRTFIKKLFILIRCPALAAIFSIFFGAHLIVTAYQAFTEKKWPMVISPKLDIVGDSFQIFGHPTDAYIGAVFLSVIGLMFISAPIILIGKIKRRSNLCSRRAGK